MSLISFIPHQNIRKPLAFDVFSGYQKRSVAWNRLTGKENYILNNHTTSYKSYETRDPLQKTG